MDFDRLKFKTEEIVLPHLKKIPIKDRDNLRTALRGVKDEKALKNILLLISQKTGKVFTLDFLKQDSYHFDAFSNATNFIKAMDEFLKIQPIYYDASKIWWVWNFKKFSWEMKDEIDILNQIDLNTKNPTASPHIKNELLEALRRRARLHKPHNKGIWLQFKDTIIDLTNEEEFNVTPEHFVVNSIPWKIGRKTDTPNMDRIFAEWVGEEYVPTLYEIIAYCTLPDYPINRIFCLYGEGLNGKTKFLELVAKFVGQNNICSTELDVLLSSRFEITRLHKKLVCLMGETNFAEMKKTAILKKLTGGDLIGFEYKNKDLFQDYNYAKLLISTNNLPPTTDKTIGFGRRWMIIDFPNRFTEKKDILSEIPDEEYSNLARKTIFILQKLLKKREFTNEGSVEDRLKKFEEKSNPFEKFWNERVEEDADEHIFKFEFRKEFDEWCVQNRFRKMSDYQINQFMKEKGIEQQKVRANWYDNEGNSKYYRAWIGLKWPNSTVGNNSTISHSDSYIRDRVEVGGSLGKGGKIREELVKE